MFSQYLIGKESELSIAEFMFRWKKSNRKRVCVLAG